MLVDRLEHAGRHLALHPRFAAAFRFLRETDLAALTDGDHEIDGRRLFVSLSSAQGRGREGAMLEAHRRYIDIHVVVSGVDEIGLKPVAACRQVELAHDDVRDLALFRDRPDDWLALPPGSFAVLEPADAHAPLATTGHVRKAVIKVLIEP